MLILTYVNWDRFCSRQSVVPRCAVNYASVGRILQILEQEQSKTLHVSAFDLTDLPKQPKSHSKAANLYEVQHTSIAPAHLSTTFILASGRNSVALVYTQDKELKRAIDRPSRSSLKLLQKQRLKAKVYFIVYVG